MKIIGSMRAQDQDRGVVRVEDVYDTSVDDLWEACTSPDRLARWIAVVSGDPVVGGEVHAVFTSTWSGPVRIDACDAPSHLLLTMEPGTDDETQVEVWITAEGSRARLVVEERGLPFHVLVDASREVTKQYGVWHRMGLDAWDIARPALFVVDGDGMIRAIFVGETQGEFPGRDEIEDALGGIPK